MLFISVDSPSDGGKLKREFAGEDVSSKRVKRSTDEDEPARNVCSDKENVANSSLKRANEQPVTRHDEKKLRAGVDDVSNGVEAVTRLPGAKQAAKPLSNLDKAIARVATGGLNKREREICELLKLLDSKSLEHITGPVSRCALPLVFCCSVSRCGVGSMGPVRIFSKGGSRKI